MYTSRTATYALAWLLVLSTMLCTSCNNSHHHKGAPAALAESEPNDTPMTALTLGRNVPGSGDVTTAGDVDYWAIKLSQGAVIQVELFATRLDQATWDGNSNIPRLTLYDTDGTTRLLEHDYGGNTTTSGSWDWSEQDLDFVEYRIPASGTYYLAVTQDDTTTDGGAYVVRWNTMSVSGVQFEAEPAGTTGGNDDFMSAQPITPGTIFGFHVDNEHDYYSFDVGSDGAIVEFEVVGYRNGANNGDDDSFDSYLYLYDTDGTTELTHDDDSVYYDAAIQYAISDPGTYYIDVAECCGTGDANYVLTFKLLGVNDTVLETEPNDTTMTANQLSYGDSAAGESDTTDTDFWSFSGTAGDMVRVQAFDANNIQNITDDITVDLFAPDGTTALMTGADDTPLHVHTTILQETGTFYIRVTSAAAAQFIYGLRLSRYQAARYETEPNDDVMTANKLDSGGRAAGVIDASGDVDVFSFGASNNRLYDIRVYAESAESDGGSDGDFNYSGHGSALRPLVTVRDAMGTAIATSTIIPANSIYTEAVTTPLPTVQVAFLAPSSGTFYVEVADAGGGFSSNHYYVVEVK